MRVVWQNASSRLSLTVRLRGDVTMVLTIPHDFERTLVREGAAPIELSVNAEKGSAAGIVQSYAARIVAAYSSELSRVARIAPIRGDARLLPTRKD